MRYATCYASHWLLALRHDTPARERASAMMLRMMLYYASRDDTQLRERHCIRYNSRMIFSPEALRHMPCRLRHCLGYYVIDGITAATFTPRPLPIIATLLIYAYATRY